MALGPDDHPEGESERRESHGGSGSAWAHPVTSLFFDLIGQVLTLVRLELSLAQAEFREKLSRVVFALFLVFIALLLASGAIMALIASAILRLSVRYDPWLAALSVGALLLGAALLLGVWGWLALRHLSLTPERTLRSLDTHHAATRER
jgi:membrane protein